jgi:hypothetical protein
MCLKKLKFYIIEKMIKYLRRKLISEIWNLDLDLGLLYSIQYPIYEYEIGLFCLKIDFILSKEEYAKSKTYICDLKATKIPQIKTDYAYSQCTPINGISAFPIQFVT